VSAPSFRLKGSGWYETDFKTGNKKNLVGGSESAGGDKSTTSSAGENKPSESKSSDTKAVDSKKTA
jgi:predicted nucleic acid-binding Zn ribbon protein